MFTHTNENRDFWIKEVSLMPSLVEGVKNSDILFLPIKKYRDVNYIFFTEIIFTGHAFAAFSQDS